MPNDEVDSCIANLLSTCFATGLGKPYLDAKLLSESKGRQIFSTVVKELEGLSSRKANSLKQEMFGVRANEGEHFSVACNEVARFRDGLDAVGENPTHTEMWFAFLPPKITAQPETHLGTCVLLCCVALVT
jgi:hypothetical protein